MDETLDFNFIAFNRMIEYTKEELENFPELLCFAQGHDFDYGYCIKCGYKDLEFFDESEEE